MWYSDAMIQRGLAACAVLLIVMQGQLAAFGQAKRPSASHSQTAHTNSSPARATDTAAAGDPQAAGSTDQSAGLVTATPGAPAGTTGNPNVANPAVRPDCLGGNCDVQPAHISIATPAPAPAPWPWQERIAWGANIVLVVLGYIAILVAHSLLRKIERQTRYGETAAQAAQDTAQALLTQIQARARAERPWVLVSVRPAQNIENGFAVMATNRGRSPARIISTVDEIVSAVDEAHLPAAPEYKNEPVAPADHIILLPGEATEILTFSRADVKRVCESEEVLARIEKWEERIFIYGKVDYRDLTSPDNAEPRESSWFCWYIHGRQKSGMVMAGPPAYNRHT